MKISGTITLLVIILVAGTIACSNQENHSPSSTEVATKEDLSVLSPLPATDLGDLSESVQEQLANERAALEALVKEASVPRLDLSQRFGRVGQIYHAYGLLDPAAVCYQNALLLDDQSFRWHYLMGVIHQTQGNTAAASSSYEEVLELQPQDLTTLLRLAEMRLSENRRTEAKELFQQVLEIDKNTAMAHYGIGRVASADGDTSTAVEYYEHALALQPGAKNIHYLLGVAYRKLGDKEAAERHLSQTESADVNFPDPIMKEVSALVEGVGPILEKALYAFTSQRFDEAVAQYRRALELDPEDPTALRGLGFALRHAGDLPAAAATLRRMLELFPDHGLAQLELATVLLEQKQLDEAIAGFRRALEIDPKFKEAHFNLGVAYGQQERWQEAIQSFRAVLDADERNHQARYHLVVALEENGQPEEAAMELRRVVTEEPGFVVARQRYGQHLLQQGNLEGAADQHRAVTLLAEAPPQEQALAHYQLGRIAKLQGKSDAAAEHFRQAMELFPELWQAPFALANLFYDSGEFLRAAEFYAGIVAADSKNIPARLKEAESLMGAGEYAAARRRLEAGLSEMPRAAELGHLLARLLATAPQDALRDGRRALTLAQQIFEVQPSPEFGETVAMAMAELGQFEQAVAWQENLIARTSTSGDQALLQEMRRNLELYRQGKPIRGKHR